MLARRFIEGMSVEVFAGDERTLYAVTRCLEIISEASRCLPDDMKARYPEVPWTRIAGAGNVYRHDYEDVLAIILWNTVRNELAGLERAVIRERDIDTR
jgi:uncharacterized protein with HEPN domain